MSGKLPFAGGFDGRRYQERFDALAREGHSVHGEADFITALAPESVLDAGCGTGRIALELARRGVFVVGVDRDPSMLAVASDLLRAALEETAGLRASFIEADLAGLELDMTFDLAVMAGNVPLFADEGTEREVVAGVAHHIRPGGLLVAGFQLDRSYPLDSYDDHCAAAGLELVSRYATWEGEAFVKGGGYAVSLHARNR